MVDRIGPLSRLGSRDVGGLGLMNLGYTFGGMPSGWIQEQMG